jgi:hypothetical protein
MVKRKPCTLCNTKTKWPYFQELLKTTLDNSIPQKTDDDITRAVESVNAVQQAAWNATAISNNSDINIEYSSTIKEKLGKRKLRKLWQTKRCPLMTKLKQIKSRYQNT